MSAKTAKTAAPNTAEPKQRLRELMATKEDMLKIKAEVSQLSDRAAHMALELQELKDSSRILMRTVLAPSSHVSVVEGFKKEEKSGCWAFMYQVIVGVIVVFTVGFLDGVLRGLLMGRLNHVDDDYY
jgi:hypothetical protein